jgi:hypothetical protein
MPGNHAPMEAEGGDGRLDVPRMAVDTRDNTATSLHLHGSAAPDGLSTVDRKRKLPNGGADFGHSDAIGPRLGHGVKKIKLAPGGPKQGAQSGATAGSLGQPPLPPEVWHRVLTFCPPKSLGNLLAVNRLFNLSLDPASPSRRGAHPSAARGALGPMEPNAIWQASRRLFWPQMPAPIRSKTELDMWRLACSPRCQDCGRLPAPDLASSPDPRRPGPGPDGVAAIWAFGSRMCATCLLKKSDKVRALVSDKTMLVLNL